LRGLHVDAQERLRRERNDEDRDSTLARTRERRFFERLRGVATSPA
jgi:hypothetical protein